MSKALELVMEDLLRKSAAIATERKGKTITPQHLKECVKREECFDFLRKIFDKVRSYFELFCELVVRMIVLRR